MNQIAHAAGIALATCLRTSFCPKPIYDHSEQRLAFETMKGQLLDQAARARAKLYVMIIQWGLTGTWPRFRNEPVYFLNEILNCAASKQSFPPEQDFPTTLPPWEPKYVARFFDRTVLSWYSVQADIWARELASEEFDIQETHFSQMHPLE